MVSQLADWKGTKPDAGLLSYGWLKALSLIPFTGLLGIDHLYLRSPLTAILKCIVNVAFFGLWYWYDIFQIWINDDITKVFGVSIPIVGYKGVGTGFFIDEPSEKHAAFLKYALCLILFGFLAGESFLVGDKEKGKSHFFPGFIFIPWIMNIYRLFFKPECIINNYNEYFDTDADSPFKCPPEPNPGAGVFVALGKFFGAIGKAISGLISSVTAIGATFATLGEKVSNITSLFGKGNGKGAGPSTVPVVPSAPALKGGSLDSNIIPYMLFITIGAIVVSGIVLTCSRLQKNERNDPPPEPGIPRKLDKEST